MEGRIKRIISNLYTVESNGKEYQCRARGKFRNDKISPVVGDFCEFDSENNYILKLKERNNELKRPTVANVNLALVITSVKKPNLSLNLLDKMLSVIIFNKIKPVICWTKLDLLKSNEKKEIKKLSKYYKSIGIDVINNKKLFRIKRIIKNKLIVLTGQTGAGKSSLLNKLNSKLDLNTAPISESLGRGVHTTRHVELFKIGKGLIADTPGFSALTFEGMNLIDLKASFKEFSKYNCQFKDCNHLEERDCKVKEAVIKEQIIKSRYDNYVIFAKEVKSK